MKVNKRLRKLKNKIVLYLDYSINGKRYLENTKLFYVKGKDNFAKEHNKKMDILFEKCRSDKFNELFDGKNTFIPFQKASTDFIEYYKNYQLHYQTKSRKLSACLNHLLAFLNGSKLKFSEVTEDLLIEFKQYLEQKVKGETPHGYFKALSRVLKQAKKEKYIVDNPAADIRVARIPINIKNTITLDEINLLKNTHCSNDHVKRAFLFACYTGLRFGDIVGLKWSSISDACQPVMELVQQKTNRPVKVPLNNNAVALLGNKTASEFVFDLPTNNGVNKVLRYWIKSAGITKAISFHCSRHSFATNVLDKTNDLFTTSKLLGHANIKQTQTYIRAIDSKLCDAVSALEF